MQTSNLDVAIAWISITKDRERMLDFSYPMFNAGLQVMAARTSGTNRTDELRGFVVAGVGRYLIAEMRADGSYDRIYEHYFGATTGI